MLVVSRELKREGERLLDLGDVSNARSTEATLLLWIRVFGIKNTGAFNFRIID